MISRISGDNVSGDLGSGSTVNDINQNHAGWISKHKDIDLLNDFEAGAGPNKGRCGYVTDFGDDTTQRKFRNHWVFDLGGISSTNLTYARVVWLYESVQLFGTTTLADVLALDNAFEMQYSQNLMVELTASNSNFIGPGGTYLETLSASDIIPDDGTEIGFMAIGTDFGGDTFDLDFVKAQLDLPGTQHKMGFEIYPNPNNPGEDFYIEFGGSGHPDPGRRPRMEFYYNNELVQTPLLAGGTAIDSKTRTTVLARTAHTIDEVLRAAGGLIPLVGQPVEEPQEAPV